MGQFLIFGVFMTFGVFAPKNFKLFGFQIFGLRADLVKVITERRRAH
jgi:hypothetical protein